MDLTLVAFYGPKPRSLTGLVAELQRELHDLLGDGFEAYPLQQVHATIVGLEGEWVGGSLVNVNYRRVQGREAPMSIRRVVEVARAALPLTIRVAGYRRRQSYPFTSRGLHPYVRSFSIQGGTAVAMGWPFDGGGYSQRLGELRRRFEEAGVLHKYHVPGGELDNDLFLVLGRVAGQRETGRSPEAAEDALREMLASRDPLELDVTRERLALVAYDDPRLPAGTSRSFALHEADKTIGEIEALYREGPGTR